MVRTAVNLGISELDLGQRLTAALGLPVTIDNDVKAAALGAANHLGLADGDLAYLNFGTGVAAAAVVHGRLVRGHGNLAGEIGHIPVDPAGDRCHCGQRGCLEVLAGGGRIAARLAALGTGLTLGTLVQAAEAGDPRSGRRGRPAVPRDRPRRPAGRAHPGIGAGGARRWRHPHRTGAGAAGTGVLVARAAESEFLASLHLADRITVIPADYPVAAIGAALVGLRHTRAKQLAPIG